MSSLGMAPCALNCFPDQTLRPELQQMSYFFLFFPFFPRAWLGAAAGNGCVRFSHHCCTIPTKLLVRIYPAKPLEIGEIMNSPAMVTGMIFIIICCCGSVVVMGVIFDTKYIERPIVIGKM